MAPVTYSLSQFFAPSGQAESHSILSSSFFTRSQTNFTEQDTSILDSFHDVPGASCCFVRLQGAEARKVRIMVYGTYRLDACASGGWLLTPLVATSSTYWIPQAPMLRTHDNLGHVTAERLVTLSRLNASASDMVIELELPGDWCLDLVFWRFLPQASHLPDSLQSPMNIEKRRYFLWGSKVNFTLPADIYLYLLHGQVYTNDFVWPRKWKFYSEIDAYGLYLASDGLELATGKPFYGLLKRQILYSVIARQAQDGGWYQGEWTDLMESHYRLHNSAMLMLEASLEERADDTVIKALERAASFLASCTDKMKDGLWFLHDSLEQSVEAMEEMRRQTNTPWIPTRILGKSSTNKLILNTHLDALVALDRYHEVTGDGQYAEHVMSGRATARALLAMRPAEALYRLIYRAIDLTLLPKKDAMALPLPLRVLKRLTWMYITPHLHRVKRVFPRIVMPSGLIERHISPLHYDINYHPVNVMDLVRYWRRFPDEDIGTIVAEAVKAVEGRRLLQYWAEAKPRQFSLVVWADALYHLCTLNQDLAYRSHLAKTLIIIQDTGLGLPPSLLGCDAEVVRLTDRQPCPSPKDKHLLVANLSHGKGIEVLVVNPTSSSLGIAWEHRVMDEIDWSDSEGQAIPNDSSTLRVPERSWVLGKSRKLQSYS